MLRLFHAVNAGNFAEQAGRDFAIRPNEGAENIAPAEWYFAPATPRGNRGLMQPYRCAQFVGAAQQVNEVFYVGDLPIHSVEFMARGHNKRKWNFTYALRLLVKGVPVCNIR